MSHCIGFNCFIPLSIIQLFNNVFLEKGPCKDPLDCLHGVLMHGDEEAGDAHINEDAYNKLKPILDTGKRLASGPKLADEMLHGVLMHGDDVAGQEHKEDTDSGIQPLEPPKQKGPESMEDYMHGVLMHGDNQLGVDHLKDHVASQVDERTGSAKPMNADEIMHGMLMHGGEVFDHKKNDSPEDLVDINRGPQDLNERMHEFMHNGEHVEHIAVDDIEDENDISSGPQDLNERMHAFMHNGKHVDHNEETTADTDENLSDFVKGPQDLNERMHALMHNGEHVDHNKDTKNSDNTPFRLTKDNLKELIDLNIDMNILKAVGLDEAVRDAKDFKEWKKDDKHKDEVQGSTLRFVSDSVLSDIEMMKQRYLARARQLESNGDSVTVDEAIKMVDTSPHGHDGDTDARHDLELIGSTQPLKYRHKFMREKEELERKKKLAGNTEPLPRY